jgi:hypothetical protein
MLTARAATSGTVVTETADSVNIIIFLHAPGHRQRACRAERDRGGERDVHVVGQPRVQPGSASAGFSSCGNWKSRGGGSGARRRIGPPRSNSQNSSPNVITFVLHCTVVNHHGPSSPTNRRARHLRCWSSPPARRRRRRSSRGRYGVHVEVRVRGFPPTATEQ